MEFYVSGIFCTHHSITMLHPQLPIYRCRDRKEKVLILASVRSCFPHVKPLHGIFASTCMFLFLCREQPPCIVPHHLSVLLQVLPLFARANQIRMLWQPLSFYDALDWHICCFESCQKSRSHVSGFA